MKALFSADPRILLIRGAVGLLILFTIALGLMISPLPHSFAAKTTKQAFKDFCFFYYHDGTDLQAIQDTATCRGLSKKFEDCLKKESPDGYTQWPAKLSLHDLADKDLLINPNANNAKLKTLDDFTKSLTGTGLEPLASDANFVPTLWDYNSSYDAFVRIGENEENKTMPYFFQPKTLTARKGVTVMWANDSDAKHTVDSGKDEDDKSQHELEIDDIDPGTSPTHTFNTVGTFDYHCDIHDFMKNNKIIVKP